MKMKVDKVVLELMIATFAYCLGEDDCRMISCDEKMVTLKLDDNTEVTLYTDAA